MIFLERDTALSKSSYPQKAEKYTLSKRWVIRYDPAFAIHYSMYDTYTGKKLELSNSLFVILRLWENNSLKVDEMYDYIHARGIVLKKEEFVGITNRLKDQEILVSCNLPFFTAKNYEGVEAGIYDVPVTSTPYEAEIHFTNACNLRCLHCAYNAGGRLDGELEPEQWREILDELEILKVFRIIISGGEPLLYPGSKYLMNYLTQKKIRTDVLTNGTLIDEEFAAIFSKPNFSVTVSLDGAKSETHDEFRSSVCFDAVLNGIRLLSQYNASFNISTTLNKRNIGQIEDLIKLSIQYGARSANFILLDPIGRGKNLNGLLLDNTDIEFISKEISCCESMYGENIQIGYLDPSFPKYRDLVTLENSEKIFCTAGTTRLSVRSDGSVFPCVYAFHDDKFKMGSLKSSTLEAIWTSPDWILFRGGVSMHDLPQCNVCKLSEKCSLKNCRLRAYYVSNDFFGVPPGCELLYR